MARDQISSGRDSPTLVPWAGAQRSGAVAPLKRRKRVATTTPAAAPPSVVQAEQHARESGLLYVCDAEPGIRRKRAGSGFCYIDPDGKAIRNARTLQRIRSLAIPPAYTDVWICVDERGHLQATGRDARGRKQYRYHPEWRATRDRGKFTRMIEFGSELPRLRRRLKRDLARPGLPKERVLALIVTLMDETLIRVGNEEYARANDSYGATTLRDRHAKFLSDGRATLSFRGKGGKQHEVQLDDRRLTHVIRRCQQLPGQQLFQYVDDDGVRQPVDSGMVNEYLRAAVQGQPSIAQEGFTAKDFRTWGATVRAVSYLAGQRCDEQVTQRAFTQCVAATAKHVAHALGNTAAVCRKSYINPVVFTAWRSGLIAERAADARLSARKLEAVTLQILKRARSQARRAA